MQQHNCCYFFLYRTAPLLLYGVLLLSHTIKKHIQKRNVRAAKALPREDSFFSLPRRDIQVPTRGPFSLPIPFQISLILEVCQPTQRLLRHFSQRY